VPSLIALAREGRERSLSWFGLARTMRGPLGPCECEPRRPGRHRGDGRRSEHLQHLHHGRADCGRRPGCGGPPSTATAPQTSKCGSADLLEALGVQIELTPEQVAQCIDEIGFGFMFAPKHHQADEGGSSPVAQGAGRPPRSSNLLGPLTNPAGARRQLSRRLGPDLPGDDRGGVAQSRLVTTPMGGLPRMTGWMSSASPGRTRVVEVADGAHGRMVSWRPMTSASSSAPLGGDSAGRRSAAQRLGPPGGS